MQTMDPEVVATRYDPTVRTAANILSVFLVKCGAENNEEIDYRLLFENFAQVICFIPTSKGSLINNCTFLSRTC